MATIIIYTPLQAPTRTTVRGRGRVMRHRCEDFNGHKHQQRLPVGSVGGVMYLDAMCLHCGAHFVWADDEAPPASEPAAP